MEGFYGNSSNSKPPGLRSNLNGSASMDNLSPLGRGRSSYYNENIDLGESQLFRYLRAGSPDSFKYAPLSPVENLDVVRSPTVYATPVKVEEDVLVMDGILVTSAIPAGRFARSVTVSGGSTTLSSSPSSGGKSLYKTDICRSWEDSGRCRHGNKCQFAHGKEELRPTRFPAKNKSETHKPYCVFGTGTYGPKNRFACQLMATASRTTLPTKTEGTSKNLSTTCITEGDWSPQDDGIEVVLPHSSTGKPPSRKDVNAYLESVLYGPSKKKRLPVFDEICS
ncbi:uncharacterized protein LOC132179467 isoform X3 [Corylus avellana]|uniref:uncharacterized protein LOC132179467 isoform X3 n=1 Tax=Corylus avellana TaxID=13451 RepID=UPI00286C2ECD|nr:uncharacterized protein LOC132179467 isoform X3 [Corylus avellana]